MSARATCRSRRPAGCSVQRRCSARPAATPAAARAAVAAGATYLGVGPAFADVHEGRSAATRSGRPASARSPAAVPGTSGHRDRWGHRRRVPELLGPGAYGVAVVGAICDAADPASAAAELLAPSRQFRIGSRERLTGWSEWRVGGRWIRSALVHRVARCAQRGLSVTVHDPAPAPERRTPRPGMLAPVGEAHFGEEALTGLLVDRRDGGPGSPRN